MGYETSRDISIHEIIKRFSEPFPFSRGLSKEIQALLRVSLFAIVLIYLFRPFGLPNAPIWIIAGYWLAVVGWGTVNIYLINQLLIRLIREEDWTVGKEVLKTLYHLLTMSLVIMLYSHWAGIISLEVENLTRFIAYTLLLGIIPAIIRALTIHNLLLREHLKEAKSLNAYLEKEDLFSKEVVLRIQSNLLKESVETTNQRLLYIESFKQYIQVYTRGVNGVKEELIRLPLKEVKPQIDDPYIVQCHRSFIVNLRGVKKVNSNSQGIRLCLDVDELEVPVSRSFSKDVVALIKNLPR